MNKRLTILLGGARSGKSSYAEKLAAESDGPVLFVATAEAGDREMAERIARHQDERPDSWTTLEAQTKVGAAITKAAPQATVLIDCITLLAANVMLQFMRDDEVSMPQAEQALNAEMEDLLAAYRDGSASWIVISNEVGMGVVPPYPSGRTYRDLLGRANQMVASEADEVLLMVAGLPWALKAPPASSTR